MRILLVEDDKLIGDGIKAGLSKMGFNVDWFTDGKTGQAALASAPYDAVVLDLTLPEIDGLEILRAWRESGKSEPVLILTARDRWSDKVQGFDAGADDYVVKPFHIEELLARVRALLRRAAGRAAPVIRHGELEVDPAARTVLRAGTLVDLSPREFAVLWVLLESRGRVQSRQQLEARLYNWQDSIESNAVEVHVHHLRRKLGSSLIHTMRGVGYFIPRESGA